MIDIYNNKQAFLNKKPKGLFLLFILLCLVLITIIILACKMKIYDNYQTKGYITCGDSCTINTVIPTNIDFEKIKLNNKDLAYEIVSKNIEIDEENFISYYKLTLKTNITLKQDEIITLNFYYNKQRIFDKIKSKMF